MFVHKTLEYVPKLDMIFVIFQPLDIVIDRFVQWLLLKVDLNPWMIGGFSTASERLAFSGWLLSVRVQYFHTV